MYRSIRIHRFRCISELMMRDLPQFNVITGGNGSGKTTLLEALYLAASPSAEAMLTTIGLRQASSAYSTGGMRDPLTQEPLWRGLFPWKDPQGPVSLEATSSGEPAAWKMQISEVHPPERLQIRVVSPNGEGGAEAAEMLDMEVEVRSPNQPARHVRIAPAADGTETIIERQPFPPFLKVGHYRTHGTSEQDARMFSLVERRGPGVADQLVAAAKVMEHDLVRIFMTWSTGGPQLHAEFANGKQLPVEALGGGTRRLLTYALAVLGRTMDVVVIDEIENGIHHSHYAELWNALCKLALDAKTQLVVTTHSGEFLKVEFRTFGVGEGLEAESAD